MKLTTNEWLRDGRWMGLCRMAMVQILLVVSIVAVIGTAAYAQSVSTTTVQGTVYLANGQPGSGTLSVSWPAFTTASGQAVAADQMNVTIGSGGYLSVNLAPNLGATPAGLFYTVVYYLSDGTTSTEYWVIPAAAQATLGSVRAQLMPAAQAVQAVSKAYVDEAISELTESQLTATGGTLTGPLYLSGDPTQPLQAADKHYVDESAALAGSLAGGALTGALTGPSITAKQLGGTYQADQFSGADFGAKLQACLSSLSATNGGTCDARNFTGSQSMGSTLTISTGNATVLLPCATIAIANQVIVTAGTRNVALRGCALRGGSSATGSQGGTVFEYSGSGAMVQVGDPTYAQDTLGFHMDNAVINTTASASATAHGLVAYRTQEMDLESLYFLGNSNQTGMTLDGTGNYTGGTFLDNEISGFQTAVNAIGHQVANSATTDWMNASAFVRLHIDCPTSGGSPISGSYGINLQQGDGNTFTGGDVEGCSTALHLGANAQNNTIVGLRNENSTNQVVADTGSSYNSWMTGGTMFTGQLTDNGTRNSFLDTFHRSFNGIKGDWYGSQQDATVINHYRIGIGAGNERGLQDRYQTDYGYRWTMGLSDATAGEQFYQILDELNNVYRISIGQYNNGQSSTNNQTVINAAGTGAVVLNGSNNSGSGGVVFGSGGASETTVATINNAGNAQFNGTLQVGGSSTFTGSTTVKNQADAEIDATLWAGLTTSQKESYVYKDWNGNSQWYMVKDASNNWALNSATGGLDSFKAYQSTNSGDTYIDTQNASGAVRINYETGAGTQFKVYGGSSSTLYASFTGTTSIQFPGLAASSGYNCLQIDNSGYITNTGSACGSGGGGGSGTVNSGAAGQIAYYSTTGTAVTGVTSIPVTAGGTGATTAASALTSLGAAPLASPAFTGTVTAPAFSGALTGHASLDLPLTGGALTGPVTDTSTIAAAGVQDTNRPIVDTFTLSTGYGGGTDECAKLQQLSVSADTAGYTGNIFRSSSSTTAGAASIVSCSTASFWDPAITAASSGETVLAPGTMYGLIGELDVPYGYTLRSVDNLASSNGPSGTWLQAANAYVMNPANPIGNVIVGLGPNSVSANGFTLGSRLKGLGIECNSMPHSVGFFNGFGQEASGGEYLAFIGCQRSIDVENSGGQGGAQNHGVIGPGIDTTLPSPPTASVVSEAMITAAGTYSTTPTVTVTGCSTAPSAAAILGANAGLVSAPLVSYSASATGLVTLTITNTSTNMFEPGEMLQFPTITAGPTYLSGVKTQVVSVSRSQSSNLTNFTVYSSSATSASGSVTASGNVGPVSNGVAYIQFTGPNWEGYSCGSSTAISFSGSGGAAATPVLQAAPDPVGLQTGAMYPTGGGRYEDINISSGNYSRIPGYGVTVDSGGESFFNTYGESTLGAMQVGGITTNTLGGITAISVRSNPANAPCYSVLDLASNATIEAFTGTSIIGTCNYFLTNEQLWNAGKIKYGTYNTYGVALFAVERDTVISSNPQIVTTVPIGTTYYNCGPSCSTSQEPYPYVPAVDVGGYAQSMTTANNTLEPAGIFANGTYGSTSQYKTSTVATTGKVPCIFPLTDTVTPGDYVTVSSTAVGGGSTTIGCHDTGSSTLPTSGYMLGQVVNDGALGSDTLPVTLSGVTATTIYSGSISYSYSVVQATQVDQSKSVPFAVPTLTTGPSTLIQKSVYIGGLPGTPVDIYRTAIGSTLPTPTVICCTNGQVTGVTFSGGSGLSFAPTGTFSGGGCSVEPVVTFIVSGGTITSAQFATVGGSLNANAYLGAGCTSAPTLTLTKSIYETGWIGQTTSSGFSDVGRQGDGSAPVATGQIAPRVAIAIQPAVPSSLANPMTTTGDTIYGASGGAPARLGIGAAGQVLTVNPGATAPMWGPPGIVTNVPVWLTYLGNGADGAQICSTTLAGDYYYTTFTVNSGATCNVNSGSGLTVHATGACTINGTLSSVGNSSGSTPTGGGGGGSGGGGTAASGSGGSTYDILGNTYFTQAAGGGASAASGGAGNAGAAPAMSQQRYMVTSAGMLDGQFVDGAGGSSGGSSGGTKGSGSPSITLICASITGTGTINASGGAGSNSAANSTGAGGGGGGGVIILSSQAAETFSGLTLNVAGGAGGTCGSFTTCGAGGAGGNGWTAEFQGW